MWTYELVRRLITSSLPLNLLITQTVLTSVGSSVDNISAVDNSGWSAGACGISIGAAYTFWAAGCHYKLSTSIVGLLRTKSWERAYSQLSKSKALWVEWYSSVHLFPLYLPGRPSLSLNQLTAPTYRSKGIVSWLTCIPDSQVSRMKDIPLGSPAAISARSSAPSSASLWLLFFFFGFSPLKESLLGIL